VQQPARRVNRQRDRGAWLTAHALADVAVVGVDAVNVHDHLGRHDQDDVPVDGRDGQVEDRLADDGVGEIGNYVAVPGLHHQPPRHYPAPVAPDGAMDDLQLDEFLGFRERRPDRSG
jgi:hypothetical protein